MSTKISPDFERLSAYIDNQLSPAEKADLEARLAKEADLQATLTDLRRTVRALRSLPPVKPPRNFTLTPDQVPQHVRARRGPLFPVFRLAAALCTLLLVLTVARDYATSSLGAAAVANVTTQGGGASTVAAPNAAPLLTPSPDGSLEAYSASGPAPTGSASQDTAVTPLAHFAQVAPTATPEATDRQAVGAATPDATNKSAAPTETQEDMTASVAAAPSTTETASPNVPPLPTATAPATAPAWRVVEIVLAALALALAGAAWLTRRA
jgi:hypothetical protein